MVQTNELKELIRIADLLDPNVANGGATSTSYSNPNYSGLINTANTAQDLAAANANRDRLTIQNLDEDEAMLINIGGDAGSGNSFVLDPGVPALLEEGEADKRISVSSAKAGLRFAAIGRVKQ